MPTCEMPPTLPLFTAKLNIYFQTPNNYEENYRVSQKFQPLQALIGGFIVSWLTASPYAGIYAAVVAATCLELKDRLYGNKFDLTDWILTVAGGAIAAIIWLII